MPGGRTGACFTGDDPVSFVLATRDGLLFARPAAQADSAYRAPNLFFAAGRAARLYFCPDSARDPVTGLPTKECLLDPDKPGPAAFTGLGTVHVSAAGGPLGSAACPSSVHVRGIMQSPRGEAFELRGSLLRFPDLTDNARCETLDARIALSYLDTARAGKIRAALSTEATFQPAAADQESLALLELATSLNERDWQLVRHLARLDDAGWKRLGQLLADGGAAYISSAGAVSPTTLAAGGGVRVMELSLSELQSELSSIKTDVTTLRTDLTATLANVQALVGKLAHFDPARLLGLVPIFQDAIESGFAFLQQLRNEFLAFKGNDCGSGTPCATFRADLTSFFDQLATLQGLVPQLAGIDSKFEFRTADIRNLVIAHTPPFFLFLMHKAFEAVLPSWRDAPSVLLAAVPPPGVTARIAAVGRSATPTTASRLPASLCAALITSPDLDKTAKRAVFVNKLLSAVAEVIDGFCPDDLNVIVAGEGGATGTSPCEQVMTTLSKFFEILGEAFDALVDKIDGCVEDNHFSLLREQALSRCDPLVSLMLPATLGGELDSLLEMVEFQLSSAQQAGWNVGKTPELLTDAKSLFSQGSYRASYKQLCQTYTQLGITRP